MASLNRKHLTWEKETKKKTSSANSKGKISFFYILLSLGIEGYNLNSDSRNFITC